MTEALARSIVAFDPVSLPSSVAYEAERSLFNVLAVAIGASGHAGVDAILRVGREAGGRPVAPVVGRRERADAAFAALANGFAGHVDDYDDTHLATVIHPAASIAATLLALAPATAPSGREAMRAFVLGCEVQLRIGVAISPAHYDEGWHITGTCGTIGAAVAAAVLLRLDAGAMAHAIGLASSSAIGQREAFGTMAKAYHAGKAAANGIRAARFAAAGATASPGALARFADAVARVHRIETLPTAFGTDDELVKNTYKPYPCGIVAHPAIDAALALAARVNHAEIAAVRVHCHPLVPELMGNRAPADGLQARFSAVHGVTMALHAGTVGLAQYADAVVVDPDVIALRARVEIVPSEMVARDAAHVVIARTDGSIEEEHVVHARGSLERPLTDREVLAKAEALVEPILPGRTGRLHAAVVALARASSLDALIAAVTA